MELDSVLKKYFGYSEFRPLQKEVITSIIKGKDTLAILPTGSGKSVCFQIPGIVLGGLTIVITPLIALMKDQVDALKKNNIKAAYFSSSLNNDEKHIIINKLKHNALSFLYLSPERLQDKKCVNILKNIQITLIIIDEAHCISEWGDTFRPSYTKIDSFISVLKNRPIIAAFTATATTSVKERICKTLGMNIFDEFSSKSIRNNLEIHIVRCDYSFYQNVSLLKLLKKHTDHSGIIYCTTRNNVEKLYKEISLWNAWNNEKIGYYHAGLDTVQKNNIQKKFIENKLSLLVCTNAFGMGINKSNVRFVIHYNIPNNLEQYYQEIGRAGRDEKHSYCYLLYNKNNLSINISFIERIKEKNKKEKEIKSLQTFLKYLDYSYCRNNFLETYFLNKKILVPCTFLCDNCLKIHNIVDKDIKNNLDSLLTLRKVLAKRNNISESEVATMQTLVYMTLIKPKTIEEYLHIPGIGEGWIKRWYSFFKIGSV